MAPKIVQQLFDGGMSFHPPGTGPFPAVLVLHGSEGGWSGYSDMDAAILAAHGFLALPIPYSKDGNVWNAGDIHEVSLDRTVFTMNALRASPLSNGRLGLYGVSRGAEHTLLIASLMARDGLDGLPDAVAILSPTDVVQGTEDELWPADMTRRLIDRLHRNGRHPEVHWYEGEGHGAWGETANRHWDEVTTFFERNLRDAD